MMKFHNIKLYIFATLILGMIFSNGLKAQVGIGNLNPDSASVLDLTNTQNKGLLLPSTATTADMSPTEKTLYFYNNHIYLNRSDGYNSLSAWKYKFNGDTTKNVFYNANGYIGIGSTNINTSPDAPLHIETDDFVSLTDNGALLLGASATENMAINTSEIQSRNNGAAADLTINEDGGDVIFGSEANVVDVIVSGKVKELDDATNTYYDLMPKGIIAIWYGPSSSIPTGWALCDGSTYVATNGVDNITTPNLSGRFVVAEGNNGTQNFVAHTTGGKDEVILTTEQIPAHKHNARCSGSHGHGYKIDKLEIGDEGDNATDRNFADWENQTNTYTGNTTANIVEDGGGKSHPHNNNPFYYSLVYMMKL